MTIKLIQLLKYHPKIHYLALVLKSAKTDILGYSLVFFISWMAFVQIMYLLYCEQDQAFSSIISTAITALEILMGKFNYTFILRNNYAIAAILLSVHNIFIVLIVVNILIAIICHHFIRLFAKGWSQERTHPSLNISLAFSKTKGKQ